MRPIDTVLSRLDRVTGTGPQYVAACPAHADGNPSLSVREADDGRVLLHCFACCSPNDILRAISLAFSDLFPDKCAGHISRPIPARDRWDWRGLLRLLRTEATVVALAADDVAAGRFLPVEDQERLRKAISRIVSVAELAS